MNASLQRRLTPWLAALVVLAGLALLTLLVAGSGSEVRWAPARRQASPPMPAPPAVTPAAMPLDFYARIWQQPLFNADRRPAALAAATVSLNELELTGVMLTPDLRMAFLHDKKGDQQLRVREGAALPQSGWTLAQVKPRSVVLTSATGRTELVLPITAPSTPKAVTGNIPSNLPMPTNGVSPSMPSAPASVVSPSLTPQQAQADTLQRARIDALKAVLEQRRANPPPAVPKPVFSRDQ